MTDRYFSKQTLAFLSALAENNTREWFEVHKQDYEDLVRAPALDFISDMANEMPAISKHFRAVPKKVGGSLMRVQRDTRFSRDKTPYKTNIGIHFRHELGECFAGVGLWHPEADVLFKVREAIVKKPDAWVKARDNKNFRKHFEIIGDTLANAPRGFAKDHPLVEDLKFKDHTALAPLSAVEITSKDFRKLVVERFKQAAPYMRFLCGALELEF